MIKDSLVVLVTELILLVTSFVFGIVSLTTNQWTTTFQTTLLDHDPERNILWVIGCAVLILLGLVCIGIALIVLLSRFFGQARGKVYLAGGSSLLAAVVFIIALGIFLGQNFIPPGGEGSYGYSFALLWTSVPLLIVAGAGFFVLKDDPFLK